MAQASGPSAIPRFESVEALVLWISERLATDTDPERILRISAEAVGRFLGAARVAYGELDEHAASIHIPLDWTREGVVSIVGRHAFYPDSWLTNQYRLGRPLAVRDIRAIDLVHDEARLLESGDNRSFIAMPLIHNGRLAALFTAIEPNPRDWTDAEIQLVATIGTRMWSALEQLRLTHRLRESEQQFRLVAENLPALCWVSDHSGAIAWANRQWHEMFEGTGEVEAELIHPEDLPRVTAAMAAMRRNGEPAEVQLRMRGRDQTWRAFLRKTVPVRDASGAILRWCGLQIDLTEKQAVDRRQALLRALLDRTRSMADPDEILSTLSEMLTEHFGISHFLYCETPDGDAERLAVFHAHGGDRLPYRHSVQIREVFRHLAGMPTLLAPRVVHDNSRQVRDPADLVGLLADRMGVRSGVMVPIVKEGALVAALAVLHGEGRHWSREDVELCEEIAERVWASVSRVRAETELRERERNQAFLIEWSDRMRGQSAPAAIVDATLELLGRHLGIARATYSEGDASGRVFTVLGEWRTGDAGSNLGVTVTLGTLGDAVDREWRSREAVWYRDVAEDPRVTPSAAERYAERGIRAFISVPMRDGSVRSILSVQSSVPRFWSDGEIQLVRDIAQRAAAVIDRAAAEQALQERERNQAFVIDWSDRIRGETSAAAILGITLEWLGRHLGVTRVTHAETDPSGRQFEVTEEWRHEVVSILGNRFAIEEVGASVDREWTIGELICYDDVATDARLERKAVDRYIAADIRSFVSVPLVQDQRMRSALSVQHHVARRWRESEVQLIRDIAQRAWVALDRARAMAALQERERTQTFLVDWSDRVRSESAPDVILGETLERLGLHFGAARANYAEFDAAIGAFHVLREWRRNEAPDSYAQSRPAVADGIQSTHLAGEVAIIADALHDPRFDEAMRERYIAVEARAFIAIPLVTSDRVRAILSVQQNEPRIWQANEIQLLRDMAERTWTILERGRAEEALQVSERVQAFLVRWSDSIRNEANPHAILSRTLRQLGEYFGVSRALYVEAAPNGEQLRVVDDWSAFGPSMIGELLSLAPRDTARWRGVLRVDDIHAQPCFGPELCAQLSAIGIGAVLTVPMVRAGSTIGLVSLFHEAPRRWTAAEIEILREVGERALIALERATSELRLAESEAQMSAFLDNAPVVMYLKDADGRYIRTNPEFARAMRRPSEELTGAQPSDLFPPAIVAQIEEMEVRARRGEVASSELELFDGSAPYSSALTISFPIPGSGSAKTAGFALDLTGRKRAEAALARSREALFQAEKMSALGSLLAGVSHELNNPLSIVVAQAVMMERQSKGSEIAVRAEKIRKAADRCARIVQTFLAMARQKRPERAAVDLNEVATAAHELADYGLRTDGIVTHRDLAPLLPLISADSDQLHQIIINLIVNAQQAMVESACVERGLILRTGLGSEPGTVILEVADTGPGISEEARRRIFEPFYTTKPQGQGTGVGLSFSQGLAEAHGGRLELVRSDRGACFRVTLPISDDLTLPTVIEDVAPPAPPPARRALVIDDEPEIAESLAEFLAIEGFECEIALGGLAAQACLADGSYDLIVSDLRMPGVDGPQLHAWIAAQRPDLLDRVAFSTGDTLGAAAARFLRGAKRPVLEKPFMPDGVRIFLQQMDLA